MNISNANVIIKTNSAIEKIWLDKDVFYVVADSGLVSLWSIEDDESIQLCARHPGNSGKNAETIAKDMFGK